MSDRTASRANATALLLIALAIGVTPLAGNAETLLGLVDTGELYASPNNGATWAILATLPVRDAVALAAASSESDLYLSTRSGSLYHSANAGAAWTAVGTVGAPDLASMTILPSGMILALTETGTLYGSSDHGNSFKGLAALAGSDWASLTRGPLGRLYALTRSGQIAESGNDGAAWSTVGAIPTSNAVSIRRRDAELFVMCETGELYRSIDFGVSWAAVAALTSSSMSALLEVHSGLLAATRQGEVASSPNGTSWAWVGAINQLNVMALGSDVPLATGVETGSTAPELAIRAPYPNPRVGIGEGTFSIAIPAADRIRMEVYDVRGRLMAARAEEAFAEGGAHSIRWNPGDLPPGIYLVRYTFASGRSRAAKWAMLR
jgi:hypothetical protein